LVYSALGKPEEVARCQRWLLTHTRSPAETVQARIVLAVQLYNRRPTTAQLREARHQLAQARRALPGLIGEPDQPLLLAMWRNARALGLWRLGCRDLALTLLERACTDLAKADIENQSLGQLTILHTNLGRTAVELGDYTLAARSAAELERISAVYSPALERASKLFARIEHWPAAARLADRALAEGLTLGRLYFHRAYCGYHLGDYARALADLSHAEAASGVDIASLLLRAAICEELGELAQARNAYQAALQKDDRRARVWADLGRVHWLAGDHAAARQALERAVALAPELSQLQVYLARLQNEEQP
jgi:tetratricopeptide (TPR) repeat protein